MKALLLCLSTAVAASPLGLCLLTTIAASPLRAEPRHAIAMHGEPRYQPGFPHFDYAWPDAPKRGALRLSSIGTFDSLNPFIIRGIAAQGLRGYVFESLLERSGDEPFSLYGLLAETIEVPEDRGSITFTLDAEAKFSDGKPVTVADVMFSHAVLRDHGRPNHRTYYSKVTSVEPVGERGIRFVFKPDGDREMALIMGLMPILPSHIYKDETFEATSMAVPIGSGPYVIDRIDAGSAITYRRDNDYWARDRSVMRGRFNFDSVRFEYFRDLTAAFEAFKTGAIDMQGESDPSRWATAYDFPALADGRIVRSEFATALPAGLAALVFNTRRKPFEDIRVRRALITLFDFAVINTSLYHGLYARTESAFERSELSSSGRPADAHERRLLAPFIDRVKPEILAGTYRQPISDGSGHDRASLRAALRLLKDAGYTVKQSVLVETATGKPFAFEILAQTREQERLFLSFADGLKRAGITVSIRQVDSAQYQDRLTHFDFDMIQYNWPSSLSPGNEQTFRWGTAEASKDGSFNFAGVREPAVDAMIAALLAAKDKDEFQSSVRALDRVLMSGDYVIPLFHLKNVWVAHSAKLKRPEKGPLSGYQLDTWWMGE